MKYKGIIFDFNGTLVFDSAKHEKAWKITSEKYRDTPFSNEELEKNVHGRTNKAIFEYIFKKTLSDEQVAKLAYEKELIYQKLCLEDKENFKIIKGGEEFLDFLSKNNVPRTIATASNAMNVNFYIKIFNLEKWFDISKIVYDDGTLKGKPNPDIYLKAAKNIELEPKDCLVFEDAILGIESAAKAGIGKIIVISGDDKKLEGEEKFGVNEKINDFSEFERDLIII